MDDAERARLTEEAFARIAEAACSRWQAGCEALDEVLSPEDRADYLAHFRDAYWADFERMAARAPERLRELHTQWASGAGDALPAGHRLAGHRLAAMKEAAEAGREARGQGGHGNEGRPGGRGRK